MNTTAVDTVVTELSDDNKPAETLASWAERPRDVD
ncbi:hypothetical protein EV192_104565 [Actinocrispum wychmicini]|uniref:Uncharacterized protein n=1 Tax=Actinocrispum wychmicini TaxID=1213861 RepID=A0A4R2JM87_9PSEU|nr:hypothetical protein EV192_104565 [Actinocrispum wychmicini]